MQRNVGHLGPDGNPGQQYYDPTTGATTQQMGYSQSEPGLNQLLMAQGQGHGGQGGSVGSSQYGHNPATPVAGLPGMNSGGGPSLTFTPSASIGSSVPVYRNVRKTIKTLAENYENAVVAQFNSDAAFIQNHIAALEREQRANENAISGATVTERDERPIPEPEVRPDAEVFALIQQRAALDAFRQASNQASWTARYLPNTAGSHVDQDFKLPPDLENPTLVEVKQAACDQIFIAQRLRKALSDCIADLGKSVQEPTADDIAEFLRSDFVRY